MKTKDSMSKQLQKQRFILIPLVLFVLISFYFLFEIFIIFKIGLQQGSLDETL